MKKKNKPRLSSNSAEAHTDRWTTGARRSSLAKAVGESLPICRREAFESRTAAPHGEHTWHVYCRLVLRRPATWSSLPRGVRKAVPAQENLRSRRHCKHRSRPRRLPAPRQAAKAAGLSKCQRGRVRSFAGNRLPVIVSVGGIHDTSLYSRAVPERQGGERLGPVPGFWAISFTPREQIGPPWQENILGSGSLGQLAVDHLALEHRGHHVQLGGGFLRAQVRQPKHH